jgi:hypothetical protein
MCLQRQAASPPDAPGQAKPADSRKDIIERFITNTTDFVENIAKWTT